MLAVVLAVYWTYALAVAPWIDPQVQAELSSEQPVGPGGSTRDFSQLFPPGSWELKRPKVLETDQGTLLFDDYRTEPSGALRLTRCSLISHLASDQSAPDRGQGDRLLVMQASDGALLEFDKPLNLARGEFGDFVRGRLLGDIRIFSPASDDGADDALLVVTRNVQIEPQRIWAPNTVDFQYGPHRVLGRDLSIQLSKPGPSDQDQDLAVGQIQSVEMVHVDHVKLLLNADSWSAASASSPASAASPASSAAAEASRSERSSQPTAVDMHCTGPFRFDFRKFVGSIEERVDVIRHHADGTSDQLNCELLEFHLRRAEPSDPAQIASRPAGQSVGQPRVGASAQSGSAVLADPAATGRNRKMRRLEPSRIVALGFPAMLRVPSMRAGARAGRFEYDFRSRRVSLHDPHQTVLHNDLYEVRAADVEYELNPSGGLGRLRASGPGQLVGQLGTAGRPFQAQWRGEVTLMPQQDHHVLSVTSGAHLEVAETGTLQADQVHLYLNELPAETKGQPRILLDRLLAIGQVQMDSPRLVAELQEARLWFRHPAGEVAATLPAAEHATVAYVQPASGTGTPPTRLRLSASILQGQILLASPAALEELHVQGNVRVRELPGGVPGTASANGNVALAAPVAALAASASPPPSVDLVADQWILEGLQTTNPQAVFVGRPARLSAQGMTVVGPQIRVQQGRNWAEVLGAGSLTLHPNRMGSSSFASAPTPAFSPVARDRFSTPTGPERPANAPSFSPVSAALPPSQPAVYPVLPLPPTGPSQAPRDLASDSLLGNKSAMAMLEPLTVSWQQGMQFDGRTARFQDEVRAAGGYLQANQQRLQFQTYGPVLEVVLNQRLDFARPQSTTPVDIETLTYLGPVEVESQTWDAQQQRIGLDSLRIRDLRFERASGRLTGQGPGGRVVHRGPRTQTTSLAASSPSRGNQIVGAGQPAPFYPATPWSSPPPNAGGLLPSPPGNLQPSGPPGFSPSAQPAGVAPAGAPFAGGSVPSYSSVGTAPHPFTTSPAQGSGLSGNRTDLIYLQVDFQGPLRGNLYQRDLEFLENVRTVYGPIGSWDQSLPTDQPLDLREEEILVTSRRLAIADMGSAVGRQSAVEIEATGNAVVRGRLFTASGERLSYARAKDQLILEGDGRSDSTLEFRRQPGTAAQHLRAGKILFYPQTQQFALQDFQALNLTDLGQLRSNQPANGR